MDLFALKSCAKFAILCVPAAVALMVWKRKGIVSRSLYMATSLNVLSSVLWLGGFFGHFVSGALLFVFWPFFLLAASILVCVWPTASAERKFLIYANGLMALWWGMLIVAPN